MLSMCPVENTYHMLKRDHSDKRFMFMFYKPTKIRRKNPREVFQNYSKQPENVTVAENCVGCKC